MQGPYHYDEQNDTDEKQAARRRAFGSQKLASVAEQGRHPNPLVYRSHSTSVVACLLAFGSELLNGLIPEERSVFHEEAAAGDVE